MQFVDHHKFISDLVYIQLLVHAEHHGQLGIVAIGCEARVSGLRNALAEKRKPGSDISDNTWIDAFGLQLSKVCTDGIGVCHGVANRYTTDMLPTAHTAD